MRYCFVLFTQIRTTLALYVVSGAIFLWSRLVCAQCCGLRSLHFPDGMKRDFGIKVLCSCPWSSSHLQQRVSVLILGWITPPNPLILLFDSLSSSIKYSAMCEMHREHLLSIPMVAESVYILNSLSFLAVESWWALPLQESSLLEGLSSMDYLP